MKSNKGITLVALVITIIVLLILAGVSISLVVGDNGVLTQSQKASKETDLASAKSALELTLSSITSTFMGDVWSDDVTSKIADNVTVYDIDKELQNNGFYIVSFGGNNNSSVKGDDGFPAVKDDTDSGSGTAAAPYKTTIVIAEGKPGDGSHTNKDSKNKVIGTTYKTILEWTDTSVRISGVESSSDTDGKVDGWLIGNETGTVESITP